MEDRKIWIHFEFTKGFYISMLEGYFEIFSKYEHTNGMQPDLELSGIQPDLGAAGFGTNRNKKW